MIGSSGEDLPWGASLRARLYPVRVKQGDIDKGQLTAMQAAVTDRTRLIFVCNPNNPTGTVVRRAELEAFLDRVPDDVLFAEVDDADPR